MHISHQLITHFFKFLILLVVQTTRMGWLVICEILENKEKNISVKNIVHIISPRKYTHFQF